MHGGVRRGALRDAPYPDQACPLSLEESKLVTASQPSPSAQFSAFLSRFPPRDRRAGQAVSAQAPPRFPRLPSARLRLLQLSRGGVRYVRARIRGHRRSCYLSALGPAVLRQVPSRP